MRKHILFLLSVLLTLSSNAQQWGCYTLIAPQNTNTAVLVDTADNAVTYHTWTFASNRKTGYSSYLVYGDTLVRTVGYQSNPIGGGGGITGGVQKVAWNGTVTWDYVYSTSAYCMHHDICPMPNGNVLLIAYEVKSAAEVVAAGCSSSLIVWSEKIVEVKPTGATTGTVVWEWHLWDHLCQNYSSSKPNYVTSIVQNPQLMNINYSIRKDWFHMNGIDYNPTLDQIVLSAHNTNEIYVIDHSTTTAEAASHSGGNSGKGGDFLWRWGNPAAYGATGPTNFNVIHDAHWISCNHPTYPNYIAAFNNKGGTGNKSCIDIIAPPYNGFNYSYTPGQVMPPATYAHRYTTAFSAQDMGSSQQLLNGNMLICNPGGSVYEINSGETSIWSKNTAGSTAQAFRYSLCEVRGPVARVTASATSVIPGTQVTLYATATSVTETNPTYSYSWSSVPTGFTSTEQNPVVTPVDNTTYTVTITNTGLGCSSSASATISMITGISNDLNKYDHVYLFPNPTTGIINLSESFTEDNFMVCLYSSFGKLLFQSANARTIDMSSFSEGIYCLSIQLENKVTINRKVILIK